MIDSSRDVDALVANAPKCSHRPPNEVLAAIDNLVSDTDANIAYRMGRLAAELRMAAECEGYRQALRSACAPGGALGAIVDTLTEALEILGPEWRERQRELASMYDNARRVVEVVRRLEGTDRKAPFKHGGQQS